MSLFWIFHGDCKCIFKNSVIIYCHFVCKLYQETLLYVKKKKKNLNGSQTSKTCITSAF